MRIDRKGKHRHTPRVLPGNRHRAAVVSLRRLFGPQVIALLCHLVERRGMAGPFMIVAPASVLPNWTAEIARWAPTLRVASYWGPPAERLKCYQLSEGNVKLLDDVRNWNEKCL